MKNGNAGTANGMTSLWTLQARNLDALSGAVTSALRQAQTIAGIYGDVVSETHRHLAVEVWRGLPQGGGEAGKPLKIARRAIDASFANAIAATQLATKLQLESLSALKIATFNVLNVVEHPDADSSPAND